MPRNAKPIGLYKAQGNPTKMTKAEINFREENEIRLGTFIFNEPEILHGNTIARKKWKEIVQIYIDAQVDFVSSSDIGVIARYCLAHSFYAELIKRKNAMLMTFTKKRMNAIEINEELNKSKVESKIIATNEMLLKLEGQLFLTPLAKVKSIPKRETKKRTADPIAKDGFGDV